MSSYWTFTLNGSPPIPVPVRIYDSRSGPILTPGLHVIDISSVVFTGVNGIVGVLAATGWQGAGWLEVYRYGDPNPNTSSLNFGGSAAAISNQFFSRVDTNIKKVALLVGGASTHVVMDIVGQAVLNGNGGATTWNTGSRIVDTRNGTGGVIGPLLAGNTYTFGGFGSSEQKVFGVVTVTGMTGSGVVKLFGADVTTPPLATTLNFSRTRSAIGHGFASRLSNGFIKAYIAGANTHLIIDEIHTGAGYG